MTITNQQVPNNKTQPMHMLLMWIKRLALPVALSGVTVWGVHHYLTTKARALDEQSQQQMVTRIVAASDLPVGTRLLFDHLSVREMPHAWVGPDTYPPDEADTLEGMLLTQPLVAGQPLTRLAITDPKPPALSSQLGPGRRAVSIPVNQISSLSGHLDVGDVVDLYVTFMHRGQRVTTLLVSAVKVLATDRAMAGQTFEPGPSTVTTVTLDVSSKQAVKLISANQDGVLTAVLRLDDDSGSREGRAISRTVRANHLAGFVGLSPSLGDGQAPDIIYGDSGNGLGDVP